MKHFLIASLLMASSLATTLLHAQDTNQFFAAADTFFKKYTTDGKVDYQALYKESSALDALMRMSAKIEVSTVDPQVYKAFWINAYNLTVIQGIVHNYPLNSPLDVNGFFDTITYSVGGRTLTLNDIENKMLRAKFDEPRFHFVLVCGAKGCPPIISAAYIPATLEQQLQDQTVKALNNDSFIKVSENRVMLSEIFKWYREDFVKSGQNELDFLNKYRNKKVSATTEISYYPYNWKLNIK